MLEKLQKIEERLREVERQLGTPPSIPISRSSLA